MVATVALLSLILISSSSCGRNTEQGSTAPVEPPTDRISESYWPISLPGTTTLPFPPSEIEKTWPIGPDKTLVARREGEHEFCICYLLAAEGKCKPIVGTSSEAEVRSASAASIEFICHGAGGRPVVSFPYLLTYDVATGKTDEGPLARDPREPVEFGFESEKGGRLLTAIAIESGAVRLEFGTSAAMLPENAGAVGWVPWTTVEWDSQRGAMTLRFRGTEPATGVVEQAAGLTGGPVLGASLERCGSDCVLLLRSDSPRQYHITHPYCEPCTMTVHFH